MSCVTIFGIKRTLQIKDKPQCHTNCEIKRKTVIPRIEKVLVVLKHHYWYAELQEVAVVVVTKSDICV